MRPIIILLDSKFIKADTALLLSLSPGVIKGVGVFETMQAYNGKIFAFNEHLNRMKKGLKAYKMRMPFSRERILNSIMKLLQRNKFKNARVRLTVWQEGIQQRISIIAQPANKSFSQKYKNGMSAATSKFVRPKTKVSHLKTIDYSVFRHALLNAQKNGFDEAILLNSKKELVETSRANIFCIKNNTLYTPAIRCGCLNGITRQKVIDCARKLGLRVKPVKMSIEDLKKADEVFMTNSLVEVMPLKSLDGRSISKNKPLITTPKIALSYRSLVKEYLKNDT